MNKEWEDQANYGDGRFAIALALLVVARAIDRLGNGDAATPMGALEAFGKHMGDKLDNLTQAIEFLSEDRP